jgi:AcrR family transcriptional regulator
MPEVGLRALKKARTRTLIADTAARLFAQSGYENVSVSDVARTAEVAEQTVYNYFPSKEQLVTDQEGEIREQLVELIRSRPSGTTAATAIREYTLKSVEDIRSIPREQWRGELPYLAAISPSVHRLVLEMSERRTDALVTAIRETTKVSPEIARLQAMALADVYQILLDEAGQRTVRGHSQARIVEELRPVIETVFDELDRWFRTS